jgi:cytoskeleton protein RodZ
MSEQTSGGGFGDKLREARERRGLSLRQIANATKISMLTLEALERNDIARLPGGIFSRGVVRSYAIEVGLDPESTIEEFMGQFPHDSVTAGHPMTTHVEDHEAVESDRRIATTFVRLVLISAVTTGVLYFALHGRRVQTPAPAPAASVAPRPEPAAEAPAAEPAAEPAPDAAQPAPTSTP